MKIERLTLYKLTLPLVAPFETSFGAVNERQTVVVRLEAEGVVGYGECPADRRPLYSGEIVDTCALILEDHLAPLVLGQNLDSVDALHEAIAPVRGNAFARAALEAAHADALAKSQGRPLWRFHGSERREVEVGVSVGIHPTVGELLDRIAAYLEDGYRRIKIKIKPGWDVDVAAAVRERFPSIGLMVDANAAYTLADADHLRGLDELDLMMIEQPFHHTDLVDHAAFQRLVKTPVCLDESITDLSLARAALELGAMQIVNIKPPRVGGLREARAIHDTCRDRGVPVWCGGLLECGIGRAHNLALATLPGFTLPGDLSASSRYWAEDVIEPEVTMEKNGTIRLSDRPGIGYEVVESRLRARAESIRELSAGSR